MNTNEHLNNQIDNTVRLGFMAVNSGDANRGINLFEDALRIDPDHAGAYLGLLRAINPDRAKPYAQQLKRCPPEDIKKWIEAHPETCDDAYFPIVERMIVNTQSVEIIKILIDCGANFNTKYALHHAILQKNRCELVKLLLEYGADPNIEYQLRFNETVRLNTVPRDILTCTPLYDAIWNAKDVNVVEILIKHGANVNYISRSNENYYKYSWSILDMAVRSNNEAIVRLLLENNVDIVTGSTGLNRHESEVCYAKLITYCALSDAICHSKNINIVKLLLEYGANPNYQYEEHELNGIIVYVDTYCGLSDVIRYTNDTKMLQLLLDYGADPTAMFISRWEDEDASDRHKVKTYSMVEMANKRYKPAMADILTDCIYKKQRINKLEEKISSLRDEQQKLQSTLPDIKGLFAETKRKNCYKRLAKIEDELKDLEIQLKQLQNMP